MSTLFLTVLNMSISSVFIVFAVLLLRLLLKKAPKRTAVLLWSLVGIRLIVPFFFESEFSLIPSAETVSPSIMTDSFPQIDSGFPLINNVINPVITDSFIPDPSYSVNPLRVITFILSAVWSVGVVALFIYSAIGYVRIRKKVSTAILKRENIYECENIPSPFVLGIIKPKIYLPSGMNEKDAAFVIAHEKAHIERKDHLIKPLGFFILAVHWFNPLLWLSYSLFCRDIELSCDEKVIGDFDTVQKADYSEALLSCSAKRRFQPVNPVAFGESDVKKRIKSVLRYKKPALPIIVTAIIAIIAVAVCFLTNPKEGPQFREFYDGGYYLSVAVDSTDDELPPEKHSFVYLCGTKGRFENGTRFEIIECNLQEGSFTLRLRGTPLYKDGERIKELVVWQGTDGVALTDRREKLTFTFSFGS